MSVGGSQEGEDAMLQKIVAATRKDAKPLLLSSLISVGVVIINHQRDMLDGLVLFKAGVLLIALYLACKLFTATIRQHLRREVADLGLEGSDSTLVFFILIKELIKTTIGVCLTLVWIAGMLYFQERYGADGLLVPVLLSLVHSLTTLTLGRLLVAGLDAMRYPQEEN